MFCFLSRLDARQKRANGIYKGSCLGYGKTLPVITSSRTSSLVRPSPSDLRPCIVFPVRGCVMWHGRSSSTASWSSVHPSSSQVVYGAVCGSRMAMTKWGIRTVLFPAYDGQHLGHQCESSCVLPQFSCHIFHLFFHYFCQSMSSYPLGLQVQSPLPKRVTCVPTWWRRTSVLNKAIDVSLVLHDPYSPWTSINQLTHTNPTLSSA